MSWWLMRAIGCSDCCGTSDVCRACGLERMLAMDGSDEQGGRKEREECALV